MVDIKWQNFSTVSLYDKYLMSVVTDTGSGCRFGWSEFASVEAAPPVTCDLASGDLCLSRPWGWRDGETSVSSATEDKSEHEWLQNVFWQWAE